MRQRRRSSIQLYAKEHPKEKLNQIAKLYSVSPMTVAKWINKDYFVDTPRKRKTKMTKKIKYFLIQKAKNKFTGVDNASSRKLANLILKKFKIKVSFVTINNWLRKILKRPLKAKKTFLLRDKDKNTRLKFKEMIYMKKIKGKDIFFTDEKRFILNPPLNKQTNQIRLDEKGYAEYKSGKGKLYEKISKPVPKFSQGIMVAGGLCYNGVGKLIFVTGTMNSTSYGQTLEYYKEDLERLGKNFYFQQDNASCHVGKKSADYIKNNFTNYLEFWPPNSPDLSPIEELWSIVEEQLNKYSFKNTEEMAQKLQWVWNRIPKTICRNLVNSFDEKIELLGKDGERVNKRKHRGTKSNYIWKNKWNQNDKIERIVYNDKILENMKNKKLKNLKRELNEIHESLVEEKKRYSLDNKKKIRSESKELYDFFLSEEKQMLESYNIKTKQKEDEISKWNNLKGKELFNEFSLIEKINNIKIRNHGLSSLSTRIDN